MFSRQLGVLAVVTAIAGVAAPAAGANDQYEPNDNFAQPGFQIAGGQRYDAMIDGLGDDDYFVLRGSGQVTISINVTADSCPDSAYALTAEFRPYDTAFSSQSQIKHVESVGSTEITATLDKGRDYRVGFRSNSTNYSDPPCNGPARVDYNFTASGPVEGTSPSTESKPLTSKPAYRNWICKRQSTAYTGGGASLAFTLKKNGTWVDRTFEKPVTAKWKWKKSRLTLYTKKGKKLYSFAHLRDADGKKYLRETPAPKNNDALICR